MSEISPAESVTDGFADELLKLGFDSQLDRFVVLGMAKGAAVPAPGSFGKLWGGLKASKPWKIGSKLLGWPLTGAFAGFEGIMGARNLGKGGIQQHKAKMFAGMR